MAIVGFPMNLAPDQLHLTSLTGTIDVIWMMVIAATQSTKPRRGPSGLIPPSAHSSSYSVGPPPPPSCSPPHEEECTLQHHQPMENEEEERRRQHYAALYDHGDMGGEERNSERMIEIE